MKTAGLQVSHREVAPDTVGGHAGLGKMMLATSAALETVIVTLLEDGPAQVHCGFEAGSTHHRQHGAIGTFMPGLGKVSQAGGAAGHGGPPGEWCGGLPGHAARQGLPFFPDFESPAPPCEAFTPPARLRLEGSTAPPRPAAGTSSVTAMERWGLRGQLRPRPAPRLAKTPIFRGRVASITRMGRVAFGPGCQALAQLRLSTRFQGADAERRPRSASRRPVQHPGFSIPGLVFFSRPSLACGIRVSSVFPPFFRAPKTAARARSSLPHGESRRSSAFDPRPAT